jgi:antitoxin ParD1/3/4
MTNVTVPLTEAMQGWIDDRIEEGEFASTADYLLELVRRDRERLDAERLEALRRHVDEGLNGPVSELTFEERMAKFKEVARARGLLNE